MKRTRKNRARDMRRAASFLIWMVIVGRVGKGKTWGAKVFACIGRVKACEVAVNHEHRSRIGEDGAGGGVDDGEPVAGPGGDHPVTHAADRSGNQRGAADRAIGAGDRAESAAQELSLDGDGGNAGV